MRTSTFVARSDPTRWISPVSSTRSSFPWTAADSSATSSRNSVPPSAASNTPVLFSIAPVKSRTYGSGSAHNLPRKQMSVFVRHLAKLWFDAK
jgi:hypothetical protein